MTNTLTAPIALLTKQRTLILEMARRDLLDKYAGQALGGAWTLVHPLFLMLLYVFIFAVVFRTKLGGTYEMPLDYVAYLLSGLIPWMCFQEGMAKSCMSVVSNSNLVKQVVFPVEVLPVKGILASLLPQLISIAILVLYVLSQGQGLHATYALLPVLILLQFLAMCGVGFVLAVFGTYLRDTREIVQLFCTGGVFLLPVFYLPQWVPAAFKPILYANPFSHIVWCWQDALYFGRFAHPYAWIVNVVFSLGMFFLGFRFFRRMKPGFGNVL